MDQATNTVRRTPGVLLASLPLVLLLASLLVAMTRPQEAGTVATVVMAVACLIAGLNSYLSFVRPALFSVRHGGLEGYRNSSGVPMIGTLFVCIGGLLGFASPVIAVAGILAYLLDTGGYAWFVFTTWQDRSLWDG